MISFPLLMNYVDVRFIANYSEIMNFNSSLNSDFALSLNYKGYSQIKEEIILVRIKRYNFVVNDHHR